MKHSSIKRFIIMLIVTVTVTASLSSCGALIELFGKKNTALTINLTLDNVTVNADNHFIFGLGGGTITVDNSALALTKISYKKSNDVICSTLNDDKWQSTRQLENISENENTVEYLVEGIDSIKIQYFVAPGHKTLEECDIGELMLYGADGKSVSWSIINANGQKADDKEYNLHISGETNVLITELKGKYRQGEVVEIATSVICDADLYIYLNGERIRQTSADAPYWTYCFTMPARDSELFFDITSTQYLMLNAVCPFLVSTDVNKITQIRIENGNETVVDGVLKEIRYWDSDADIEDIFNQLAEMTMVEIPRNMAQIAGAGYKKISIFTEDGVHEIVAGDGCIIAFDGKYYRMGQLSGSSDVPVYNSFVTHSKNVNVCRKSDGSTVGEFSDLGKLEFCEYNGSIDGYSQQYYLDTVFGRLDIISNNMFGMAKGNGIVYYQITGDVDFSSVLE